MVHLGVPDSHVFYLASYRTSRPDLLTSLHCVCGINFLRYWWYHRLVSCVFTNLSLGKSVSGHRWSRHFNNFIHSCARAGREEEERLVHWDCEYVLHGWCQLWCCGCGSAGRNYGMGRSLFESMSLKQKLMREAFSVLDTIASCVCLWYRYFL